MKVELSWEANADIAISPLRVEETWKAVGFPANLFGSMPRATDSDDSGTTSPKRSLPDAAFR
jgi:hypothetical protein